jgi:hypothetical protein
LIPVGFGLLPLTGVAIVAVAIAVEGHYRHRRPAPESA